MIIRYSRSELGQGDHGWLKTRFHFSFADYHNPKRMHFGVLRVINDDCIAAHSGFGKHPHDNMEIITYVRQGAISHQDSIGNSGKTIAGDVQVMSAGSGIFHSEQNDEDEETVLYQIWIFPNQQNVVPRWDAREFPKDPVTQLTCLVSGRAEHQGSGALFIYQDAALFGGRLKAGTLIHQAIKYQAYLLVANGAVTLNNDLQLEAGDGAEITDLSTIEIMASTDAEVLLIDIPRS